MPRKNVIRQVPPRPSFAQIAAHLAVNSDSDNLDVIDTRTQSNEFLTLQNLSGHLHSEIDRTQPGHPCRKYLPGFPPPATIFLKAAAERRIRALKMTRRHFRLPCGMQREMPGNLTGS